MGSQAKDHQPQLTQGMNDKYIQCCRSFHRDKMIDSLDNTVIQVDIAVILRPATDFSSNYVLI